MVWKDYKNKQRLKPIPNHALDLSTGLSTKLIDKINYSFKFLIVQVQKMPNFDKDKTIQQQVKLDIKSTRP